MLNVHLGNYFVLKYSFMKTLLLFILTATISNSAISAGTHAFPTQKWNEGKPVIKLYPNPSYDGSITISSTSSEPLQFYVFDLDGKMIYQATLKDRNKLTITGLKKGSYMYNVLKKDENIDAGKIIVK